MSPLPGIAGLLLAAGRSTRMAGGGKLLRELGGAPLVRRAAEVLVDAGLEPVVVVVGPDGAPIRQALRGLPVRFAENPRPEEGMASSLAAGVAALPAEAAAVAVALGDMPDLAAATVRALADALEGTARGIAVPTFGGRRGHPVLFRLPACRAPLLGLRGDRGARDLLAANPADVIEVPVDDAGILLDVDTEADLARLRGGGER